MTYKVTPLIPGYLARVAPLLADCSGMRRKWKLKHRVGTSFGVYAEMLYKLVAYEDM